MAIASMGMIGSAWCQDVTTPGQAFQAGKDFANGNAGRSAAGGAVNATTGAAAVPKYNTNPPQTSVYGNGRSLIGGAGSAKQSECQSYKAGSAYEQQECNAVNFLTKNPGQRPKFVIDKKNDPLIVGSGQIIKNPGAVPGSGTSACHIEQTTVPGTFISETCTETQSLETLQCNRVLVVSCPEPPDGCDQGGIVSNSYAGDMAVSFTPDGNGNYMLQFGTIADNYWSGWGATFDRTLTFTVKDMSLITLFKLTRAAFDDWILVSVNGTVAYVGPYGGDRLEVVNRGTTTTEASPRQCQQTVDDGGGGTGWQCFDAVPSGDGYTAQNVSNYQSCTATAEGYSCFAPDANNGLVQYGENSYGQPELFTSWNQSVEVDVLPLLKEGKNTIFVRTIVAGNGEGAAVFTTRQRCPKTCSDTWDESQCDPLKARAGK